MQYRFESEAIVFEVLLSRLYSVVDTRPAFAQCTLSLPPDLSLSPIGINVILREQAVRRLDTAHRVKNKSKCVVRMGVGLMKCVVFFFFFFYNRFLIFATGFLVL